MGTAARVTGFNRVIDLTGAQQPLPSGGEVAAGEVLDIIANVDWVKVEGPDNLTIDWSGDRGINPQFPGDTVNDRMRTSFALGNHTFKARGAKGAKTITVVATDTGHTRDRVSSTALPPR